MDYVSIGGRQIPIDQFEGPTAEEERRARERSRGQRQAQLGNTRPMRFASGSWAASPDARTTLGGRRHSYVKPQ